MHLPSPSSHYHCVKTHKTHQNMDVVCFGFGFSFRRLFLGALLSLGIMCFMFLTISTMNLQTKRTILVPMNVNVISKHLKLVGIKRHVLHSNSKLVYVSKRRVPNGPDPIHNRRAAKYRQPPNQA
ncbi:unnamed protein product [Lathyrus oleraceus]|nr:CLAVATA3/ESR (CLE)-related protein 25 [Pisum sativum]